MAKDADVEREEALVKELRRDYGRAMADKVKGRAVQIDAYVADEPVGQRPLVVFHHIKKTAGTAMRLVIHGNHRENTHVVGFLRRRADRMAWWEEFYADKADRVLCVAGHDAAF